MLRLFAGFAGSVLLLGAVVGMLIEGLQVGLRLEPAVLAPDISRLAPAGGARRLAAAAPQTALKFLSSLCLLLLMVLLLRGLAARAPAVFFLPPRAQIGLLSQVIGATLACIGFALLAFGVCEYLLQRRSFRRELGMSLEELREEQREAEGEPTIKAARRAEHERLARRDMAARVRRARVIIVEERQQE